MHNETYVYLEHLSTIYTFSNNRKGGHPLSGNDRVGTVDGGRGLGSNPVLRFTKELLDQVDTLPRHFGTGGEFQRFAPIEDHLAGNMALENVDSIRGWIAQHMV